MELSGRQEKGTDRCAGGRPEAGICAGRGTDLRNHVCRIGCEIPGCGGRSSGMRSGKAGGKRAGVNTAVSCFCSEEMISWSRLPAISGI